MTVPSQGLTERILMGLVVVGLAIGCWLVIAPFVSAILWGGILVFTTWPVFRWFTTHLRLRDSWAAGLMVLLTAVLIVLPLALVAPAGADDAKLLRGVVEDAVARGLPNAPTWLLRVPLVGGTVTEYWNLWAADLSAVGDTLKPYLGSIVENGLRLMLSIAGGLLQFLLALVVAFFFYASGDTLAGHLRQIVNRIAGERAPRLIAVTGATIRGTVYGIMGTAIVQGFLTTFGLYVAGVPRPVLLGTIAGFLSVLPIGAPVIWIPAAFWLLTIGQTGWGVFLFTYGLVFVSGSDNVIRPYFIARGAKLPFLLTILGVLGGALAFGLLGIFLGPVLLGVGFTLVAEFAGGESLVEEQFTGPLAGTRPRVAAGSRSPVRLEDGNN
jgi:predicted PurR-regulated permease PerM